MVNVDLASAVFHKLVQHISQVTLRHKQIYRISAQVLSRGVGRRRVCCAGVFGHDLCDVEPVEVHHLGPCGRKVAHKLFRDI